MLQTTVAEPDTESMTDDTTALPMHTLLVGYDDGVQLLLFMDKSVPDSIDNG